MAEGKPRLLLVDDDGRQLELFRLLHAEHFCITSTTAPEEALELLTREHYDIVVSDLMMPVMTGVDFLARVRRIRPTVSRVVTSAFAEAAEILPAIDAGDVHHFVTKPVSPADLLSWFASFAPPPEPKLCLVIARDRRLASNVLDVLDGAGDFTAQHATELAGEQRPHLVVFPSPVSPKWFSEQLARLTSPREDVGIIVALSADDVDQAASYLAAGADEIVWLPVRAEEITLRYQTWRARRDAAREAERVRSEVISQGPLPSIVGRSPAMRRVFNTLHRVAGSDVSVLLTGETGTGKEMMARALHALSHRSDGPFMAVNLQAMPEALIEGELFGHEKGAFTGAATTRKGRLEAVDGGTLFLDEIGDVSANIQVKLLRLLEQRTFERLGSSDQRHADFRLVCATNQPLEQLIAEGTFREDLYYRINVVQIELPPLRDRGDDVRLLAQMFLDTFRDMYEYGHLSFSDAALQAMMRHHWPGNVRELKHVIERAVAMSQDGDEIGPEVLWRRPPRSSFEQAIESGFQTGRGLREILADIERTILVETLQGCGGNQVAAAKRLKIPRQTLQNRLKKYGL